MANAPAPHDTSSLGLASWYSKFIPDFSTVVEPTERQFNWTAEHSFTDTLIVGSPALALYDPELPTYVTTDASDYGVGGVLSQLHPDTTERVMAFASRTLSPAER